MYIYVSAGLSIITFLLYLNKAEKILAIVKDKIDKDNIEINDNNFSLFVLYIKLFLICLIPVINLLMFICMMGCIISKNEELADNILTTVKRYVEYNKHKDSGTL